MLDFPCKTRCFSIQSASARLLWESKTHDFRCKNRCFPIQICLRSPPVGEPTRRDFTCTLNVFQFNPPPLASCGRAKHNVLRAKRIFFISIHLRPPPVGACRREKSPRELKSWRENRKNVKNTCISANLV